MSTITITRSLYIEPARSIPEAPTFEPSVWSHLIDVIDAEGPFSSWTDFLSEAIRDEGARAIGNSEAEFLENQEFFKEALRQMLQDPILSIALSRPVVVVQDVVLIDEGGNPYLIEELPYHISREATYQEDTLLFYQKYMHYYKSPERISYVPHDLARAVIELLDLFPDDALYEPMDASVDPTSLRANALMISSELFFLNQAFVGHDSELKSKAMTEEDLLAEAENLVIVDEVARQCDKRFQVHLQQRQESCETFKRFLEDRKKEHDARILEGQERLNAARLLTGEAREQVQRSSNNLRSQEERLEAIRTRAASTIQRCAEETMAYSQATNEAMRRRHRKAF